MTVLARFENGPRAGYSRSYCQQPPSEIRIPLGGNVAFYSVFSKPVRSGRRIVQRYRFDFWEPEGIPRGFSAPKKWSAWVAFAEGFVV